ncbi:sugar phosphate isomerase/epimerase family protein [Ferrimonas marina]|uniref:Xylose isomerase-like TIM barrel domain-containing protein n=1 Tax=Ferrimonas marina TaxID=299255 RepID=A0A1M5UH55_9GAMM|nr:TIM barrel protein [Ferrimonas marina]SHH62260.1 hypothetical protein SAMN02745129_2568 [Ferrimonas marina]
MPTIGLKLYLDNLHNEELFESAIKALREGEFDYLEAYVRPGALQGFPQLRLNALMPFIRVVHAPHIGDDFDPARRYNWKANLDRLNDSFSLADICDSDTIIIHPGLNHGPNALDANIEFLHVLNDPRIAIENVPASSGRSANHLGNTPDSISRFLECLDIGFCFDFSHAVVAGLETHQNPHHHLAEFMALQPRMYHLCDGLMGTARDLHWHLGQGDFPLPTFLDVVGDDRVSLETGISVPRPCLIEQRNDAHRARQLASAQNAQ